MLNLLIATFVPLTIRMKKLSTEFSIIQLILVGIMGINFLSYWEITNVTINIFYLFIFYGCLWLMIMLYLIVSVRHFKKDSLNESDQHLLRKIRGTLAAPLIFGGMVFSFFSGLMVHATREIEPRLYDNPFLKLSYIVIAVFIFFFFVAYFHLMKIGDNTVKGLLSGEKFNFKEYDIMKIKKYSLLVFISIIVSGSFIETQRGMWIMWIETILLVGLMFLILWKIYKHVFYTEHEMTVPLSKLK